MKYDELVVITQKINNRSLPFLVSNRTYEKVNCIENEARTDRILEAVKKLPQAVIRFPQIPDDDLYNMLTCVHKSDYIVFLKDTSDSLQPSEHIIEHPFIPPGVASDTPIISGIFEQAFEAAKTAMAAGLEIIRGSTKVYAVCRPPGHHAGRSWMGGYCYFNNAVIAVKTILNAGIKPIGLLDIDFHFGNGSADILKDENDVVFVSLHASTENNYPYLNVTEENERHLFIPFSNKPSKEEYLEAIDKALSKIITSGCKDLVVAIGYDIIRDDPHGKWDLPASIFEDIGKVLRRSEIPVCLIQEGGYLADRVGECAYMLCKNIL